MVINKSKIQSIIYADTLLDQLKDGADIKFKELGYIHVDFQNKKWITLIDEGNQYEITYRQAYNIIECIKKSL